ncbi:hypothetical protein J1614_007440 [Plenodomus biglobosus]|nr:hypothetical protein J1614_007440 [Plenodomus biglobosus]
MGREQWTNVTHLVDVIEELVAELKADYEIKLRWRRFSVGTLHAFLVRLSEVATVFQANNGRLREFKDRAHDLTPPPSLLRMSLLQTGSTPVRDTALRLGAQMISASAASLLGNTSQESLEMPLFTIKDMRDAMVYGGGDYKSQGGIESFVVTLVKIKAMKELKDMGRLGRGGAG